MNLFSIRLTGQTPGLKKAIRRLSSAQNSAPAWRLVGERQKAFLAARFDRLSAGGGEWPPNAKSTIRQKGHGRIMQRIGQLRHAFDPGANAGLRIEVSKSGVTVAVSNATHNSGLTFRELVIIHASGGRLPIREVMAQPNPNTRREMSKIVRDYALE